MIGEVNVKLCTFCELPAFGDVANNSAEFVEREFIPCFEHSFPVCAFCLIYMGHYQKITYKRFDS